MNTLITEKMKSSNKNDKCNHSNRMEWKPKQWQYLYHQWWTKMKWENDKWMKKKKILNLAFKYVYCYHEKWLGIVRVRLYTVPAN